MPNTCNQDNSEIVSNIVTDYNAGMNMANIGKKYSMHTFKVSGILYAKNIVGRRLNLITDEVKDTIISLYNSGMNIKYISGELGISDYHVRKILLKNNIKMRKKGSGGKLKMERNLNIYREYIGSNTTAEDIAEKYGISPERVRQIIKVVDLQFGD